MGRQTQQDRGILVPYLRQTRLNRGLTQRDLAKQAKGGYVTVSRAENGGKVLPSTIRKWAKVLKVSSETLTGTRAIKQQ